MGGIAATPPASLPASTSRWADVSTKARRVTTNVRLPAGLHRRLTREAKRRGMSVNGAVVWALAEYLPVLESVPTDHLRPQHNNLRREET